MKSLGESFAPSKANECLIWGQTRNAGIIKLRKGPWGEPAWTMRKQDSALRTCCGGAARRRTGHAGVGRGNASTRKQRSAFACFAGPFCGRHGSLFGAQSFVVCSVWERRQVKIKPRTTGRGARGHRKEGGPWHKGSTTATGLVVSAVLEKRHCKCIE